MMRKVIIFCSVFLSLALIVSAQKKIEVLLLSGQNNHNWQETTPALKQILEKSERFAVTVLEKPETISVDLLKKYQLILSNWNRFPETHCNWSDDTKVAFMNFVKDGGGVLFVHAATSVNSDWQDFQHLSGATWGKGTRHGHIAPFEVVMKDKEHPITKGLSSFQITDELWVNMQNYHTSNVLAEAFAPKSNNGRGMMEPILMEQLYGKGRSVFLVLGHDKKTMRNQGFQTLLLRSAEWAGSGKVKQSIPHILQKESRVTKKFRWKKKDDVLALMSGEDVLWQLNFSKDEGKPYFHPLKTTNGTIISCLRPEDHPWHRGIWFSWKFINGLNYWEEDRQTGVSEGITELISVKNKTRKTEAISTMLLSYHPPHEAVVLSEQRTIKLSLPDANGNYHIDWTSSFTAMTDDVILDRTPLPDEPNGKKYGGYAGFSTRLDQTLTECKVINDREESQNLHGTRSRWMTFQAKDIRNRQVCVTIFDHPNNIGHPNQWYITLTDNHPFYFFSPSPLFGSKLVLKKDETLVLKYRMLVSPARHDETLIKKEWNNFKTQ